jgi:hypothetical protein
MKKNKSAEEYTREEILEWVGAGPKKQGIWHLTEEQVAFFENGKQGIIYCKPLFRYTKWEVSEHGSICWEPSYRSNFLEAETKFVIIREFLRSTGNHLIKGKNYENLH